MQNESRFAPFHTPTELQRIQENKYSRIAQPNIGALSLYRDHKYESASKRAFVDLSSQRSRAVVKPIEVPKSVPTYAEVARKSSTRRLGSVFAESFADPRKPAMQVASITDEALQQAFDVDGMTVRGILHKSKAGAFLCEAMGVEAAAWIVDKFVKWFFHDESTVSLGRIQMEFQQFKEAVLADAQPKRPPCVMTGMQTGGVESSDRDDNVKLNMIKSCYQSDFCERAPTSELFRGTTKDCSHVPGYAGHLPMNKRHEQKAKHASGDRSREPHYDLHLTSSANVALLGYTGFVPRFSHCDSERVTGTDLRTTSGAAALSLML